MMNPLAATYGALAAARASAYRRGWLRQERLPAPVVSVGNLAVGGRGKTPVVARVVGLLREGGRDVAVLSRGYRGAYRDDALLVSDGERVFAGAREAGDEPVMLARMLPGVPVAVGRRRVAAGRLVLARLGPRVFVLDDGFQHLALARDLDVVCLDWRDLAGEPLPTGRLREFRSALDRADIVLLAADGVQDAQRDEAMSRLGVERTHVLTRRALGFATLVGATAERPGRAHLLAGIARPERFQADVRLAGVEVTGTSFFADHHAFTRAEVAQVAALAVREGADAIVTTAKDAVRLGETPTVATPVVAFLIDAVISDEARLRARLLEATAARAA